ncbi:MAG TPA: efflux RND transporter periplasmic adaptor subunit [Calditrichia bacterium]|nr:efflux RND transporter periplasmic adaptor subunit [Calditrichia bacterium]
MKKWLIGILVLVALGAVFFFASADSPDETENTRRTVTVTRQDILDKALAVGSIEPINEIEVKAKVSGVVGKVYAEVGDFVKAGQPLLEVKPDPTPLELAEAKREVEMATIELETLARELDRNKELKAKGLISDRDYDDIAKRYDEAKLRRQVNKDRLDLIEKGKVRIADTNIETVVKAPLTGYILEREVNLGDPVVPLTSYQPGTALMRMANMDNLIFKGTVDEIDVGKIEEGMSCDLQVGALPGKSVTGSVTLISLKAQKEDNTTVFPIEIRINKAEDAVLRAGYSANAHIVIAKREKVLTVPERVVYFRNDSAFVKIPVGETDSEERYIKTGLSDAILIEVTEGLKEEDVVLEKEVKEIT